jgi:hypothetical protein
LTRQIIIFSAESWINTMLIAALIVATVGSAQPSQIEEIVPGNPSYRLTTAQVATLELEASDGSCDASMRLSDHYFFDLSESERPSHLSSAEAWALIGAENGCADAQFRTFEFLRYRPQERTKLRAMFWLKRAADLGNEDATQTLEFCPTIDSTDVDKAPCFGPPNKASTSQQEGSAQKLGPALIDHDVLGADCTKRAGPD